MPTGTNRWGTVEWGASAPNAGSGLTLDVANCLLDVIYRLGFAAANELTSTSWVTTAELYQFADDAEKKLSYEAGLFIVYDASVAVSAGTAVYNLPATHVFTLVAAVIDVSGIHLLRASTVGELWALDATWEATNCAAGQAPTRSSLDAGAVGTLTLYPIPSVDGTLGQICQEFPGTVEQGQSMLPLPTVLQDYFSYRMLAGARGKESDHAMPEMAAHFQQRCELYEQIGEHLWGPGQ